MKRTSVGPGEDAQGGPGGRGDARLHPRGSAPGVTTAALDQVGRDVLERRNARSNFLGYGHPPFTGVICASPNDVIVHGIPGPYVLHEGDIISIDCGAIVEGWHGDAAFTMGVGAIDADAARLIEVTEASLAAGIAGHAAWRPPLGHRRRGAAGRRVGRLLRRA